MLTVALLGIAVVLGIVGLRATTPTVQIVLIVGAVVTLLGFFSTVIWSIRRLGVFALLETNQMMSYWQMEAGAKGILSPPVTPPIPDPWHPARQLLPPEEEQP